MFLKKERIRWIAVFVAIALLFVGVTVSLCLSISNKTSSEKSDEVALNQEDELSFVTVKECGIKLLASAPEETRGGGDSAFEKRLIATVLPSDAPDKTVDWAAAWGPGSSRASENVSEYLTVTPNSDGSNIAFVRCLRAFEGDKIIVTVTTRVGGYRASCEVQYKGIPQTMAIDTSGKTIRTDSAWNLSMIELNAGETYSFNLTLDNDLHAVGSTYGQYDVTIIPHGSIDVDTVLHNNYSGEDTYGTATVDLEVAGTFESDGYTMAYFRSTMTHILFRVTIENGRLNVEVPNSASTYHAVTGGVQVGFLTRTFRAYTDGKMPYATITVTEKNTGLSKTINVKAMPVASSVTVSPDEMTF